MLIPIKAPTRAAYSAVPTLNASINAAPSLIPNILDSTAPNAQEICLGYKVVNVATTDHGYTADLTLAGEPCNVYGNDIIDLSLVVEYQSRKRLSVKMYPRYLVAANTSQYLIPGHITGLPGVHDGATLLDNDLNFTWTNEPSFQFEISRGSEILFSTLGTVIVFEDRVLELVTSMVPEYNVYGLAEHISHFRLGNNLTRTFYAADDGNPIDS